LLWFLGEAALKPTLDGNDLSRRLVCWPEEWLTAAVKAGLAEKIGDGRYVVLGGEGMRDKLQAFAESIAEWALRP